MLWSSTGSWYPDSTSRPDNADGPAQAYHQVVAESIAAHAARFGFQRASVANQRAHLLSLLESQIRCWGPGKEARAVACLERLTLEPYARWLEDVEQVERGARRRG